MQYIPFLYPRDKTHFRPRKFRRIRHRRLRVIWPHQREIIVATIKTMELSR
jgi:hypothetical protein